MKLTDFILKTKLENTDEKQKTSNSDFDTEDYVFIQSQNEVESLIIQTTICYLK